MNEIKPYSVQGGKKNQVNTMFDRIAPYYDFLNGLLSAGIDRRWRKKTIHMVAFSNPKTLLDVATGTADLAIEAAIQLPDTQITGIDISKEMLEIGRHKVKQRNLHQRLQLQQADSENLPFPDNTFEAITVAFGVRNFENLAKGLLEMYRVLKPGGVIAILEFSRPTGFLFKKIFNVYFKYLLPLVGRFTSKDPKAYRYLYESVQAFPDGENFLKIFNQTGFKSGICKKLTMGICSIYYGVK